MIVVCAAEIPQSYIAHARSSGRCRPSVSSRRFLGGRATGWVMRWAGEGRWQSTTRTGALSHRGPAVRRLVSVRDFSMSRASGVIPSPFVHRVRARGRACAGGGSAAGCDRAPADQPAQESVVVRLDSAGVAPDVPVGPASTYDTDLGDVLLVPVLGDAGYAGQVAVLSPLQAPDVPVDDTVGLRGRAGELRVALLGRGGELGEAIVSLMLPGTPPGAAGTESIITCPVWPRARLLSVDSAKAERRRYRRCLRLRPRRRQFAAGWWHCRRDGSPPSRSTPSRCCRRATRRRWRPDSPDWRRRSRRIRRARSAGCRSR